MLHALKAYDGVAVKIYSFIISALPGGKWSASRPDRFATGKITPVTYQMDL
jgi:hypothetical protein